MPKITVLIPRSHQTSVVIAVEGVAGTSCQDLTANIERALGGKSQSVPTAEYYEAPVIEEEQQFQQE
jgi:hypothetical protein